MHITISDYTKRIKGVNVLNNINLEFESGNIYGLKGVNGSGKTMLMRAKRYLFHQVWACY